jgi:epoxyqueuosine reductase QueG
MTDRDDFYHDCREFLNESIGKKFVRPDDSLMYDDLLAGFQKADHPVFNKIEEIIPEHLKPSDFLSEFSIDNHAELSVISLAFLFNIKTVEENSRSVSYPSVSWYKATDEFAAFTSFFREFIKAYFAARGNHCVFPNTLKGKYRIIWTNEIKYSTWSERHIAYACGLGSFGLHGSLITRKGCAHRIMSFILDRKFERYDTPDQPWNKNCLSANGKKCGECIKKCPVNSIGRNKRFIAECLRHESIENKEAAKKIIGQEIEACGLCMSGVPCSSTNPMERFLP